MKINILLLILLCSTVVVATECGVCVCEDIRPTVDEEPEEISTGSIILTLVLGIMFVVLLACWAIVLTTPKKDYDDAERETSHY